MSLIGRLSGGDEQDPVGGVAGPHEVRKDTRPDTVARGTLACPRCDAPVALSGAALAPADALECPYCGATGPVREFLSLASPTRPARVVVRVRVPPSGRGVETHLDRHA